MILRRVIEHVKTQNWTAIFLDFIIVVMGVFIGIQVANWNAARGDRAAEADYLQALHNDAIFSIGNLERSIKVMEAQQAARRVLYDFSRDPAAIAPPDDINGLLQAGLFNITRFNVSQIAFNALTSSGRLSLIEDAALATALQELESAILRARQVQDENIQFTYEFTDPFLIDQADMEGVVSTQIVGDQALLGWPVGSPQPETFAGALKSRRFKNLVIYQAEIMNGRLQTTRDLLDKYREVLALIEARQIEIGGAK